ncbi:TPA: DUF4910 domain-containing protein [Candidatus Poribacteria bacterium]|nr:DUF4910 domain-containing protein [Candidatus Poribacteria bacterium]
MYKDIMNLIISELQTRKCIRDIAQHWSYRSTVPGPGLRNVSNFLCQRHRENGIKAEVIPYPADDKTEWLNGHKNPLEWLPRSAKLEILKPNEKAGLICSYAEEPLCLVSNSTSTPKGGIDAPVVIINNGSKDEDYEGIDLSGKIIFTNMPAGSVEGQARKRGAVGIISDCVSPPWLVSYPPVREPEDAPDLTMWSILSGTRNEKGLWGFNLSARQGRRLRKIIQESNESVILHAEVDADLIEGSSELVNAILLGTDLADEEIWVLAHSSEPGARDNASGCCLSVEIARTLKTLIDSGKLPPLRRSIRFLNAVEVSGFLPYIDSRKDELDKIIAGICLDSVGQDFSLCGGEFVLFQSPETNASFIDGLMEQIFSAVSAEPISKFSNDNYATFPWHTEKFWGNDAFVSDGFFDIPTPQISTWPDRFYHSSMDRPEQMSDNTLGRAGAIVGTCLYLLATADAKTAIWFAGLAMKDWKKRISQNLITEAMKDNVTPFYLRSFGKHLGFQGQDAITQVLRFAKSDKNFDKLVKELANEMRIFADNESENAVRLLSAISGQEMLPLPDTTQETVDSYGDNVLKRLWWQHPPDSAFSDSGRERLRALREHGNVGRIWNWINGRRTVKEIYDRVQFNGAIPYDIVQKYAELLVDEGFAIICK